MASFDEYRKKLNSMYGNKKDENEEEEKDKGTSSFDSFRRQMESQYGSPKAVDSSKCVDADYVNSFVSDAESFLNSFSDDYSSMGFENSSDIHDAKLKTADDLNKRSFAISQYLDENKDNIDEETFKSLKTYLDEFGKASSGIRYAFYKANKFYSAYGSEEEYYKTSSMGITNPTEYEKMLKLDLGEAERWANHYEYCANIPSEIDRLKNHIKTLESGAQYNGYNAYTLRELNIAKNKIASFEKEYSQYLAEYGSKEKIQALATEARKTYNNAKRLQNGVALTENALNADDFEANSQYVSTKLGNRLAGKYGMGYDDLTYEYINGDSEMRSEIKRKHAIWSRDNVWGGESPYEENGYDYMTPNEVKIYNYYYSTQGKKKAQEYLDYIQESLNYRNATEKFEGLEGKTFLEFLFGVEAGIDQFKSGIESLFSNEDYIPQSATQITSGMVREDLADVGFNLPEWMGGSSIGQVGYDLTTTTSNMLPSILVSFVPGVGQVASPTLLGASAAGNAKAEMLRLGYSKEQANTYGLLVGASEGVLQYALGGISALGGKVSGNVINKVVSQIDNGLAKAAIKLGGNMVSEGVEEALQSILEPYFKSMATAEDFEGVNWEEVVYSGLLGMLSAGVLEGPGVIASSVANNQQVKQHGQSIIDNGGVDPLKALAMDVAGANQNSQGKKIEKLAGKVEKLAGKVEKNASAKNVGRLSAALENTISSQNVADLQNALVKKGMSSKEATRVAKYLWGEVELTDKQVAKIEGNADVKAVVDELLNDPKSTVNERARSLMLARGIGKSNKTASVASQAIKSGGLNVNVEADVKNKVSDSGKTTRTSTGEAITIDKNKAIAKVKTVDGERVVYLNTDQGVVEASDINYKSESEALIYESFTDMNPAFANAVIKNYDGSVPAQTYINGMREGILLYGMHNFQAVGKDISNASDLAELSETDQAFALKLGRAYAKADAKVAEAPLRKAMQNAEKRAASDESAPKKVKGGKVSFENGVKAKTRDQKNAVRLAKYLSEAIGIDIVFYDAKTTTDNNGKGANGYFDEKTNSIHLDIQNAHNDTKTIAFTLSHEVVHFIKKWSPAKFNTFANFLMEQYAEHGVDTSTLLANKMANLGTKDTDLAYEEMICDACETMLLDSNAMVKLMQLRQTDLTLFEKLKLHIAELLNAIREAYRKLGYESTRDEAKALLKMTDVLENLHALFEEAAVDATRNFQAEQSLMDMEENTDIVPVESVVKHSYKSLAQAAGFEARENADGSRSFVRDGKAVSEVTVEDIENSPIGAFINYSLDNGDIAEEQADRQKQMFADICTMACKTNDFSMTMQFVGSAVFTGMKANADKQYGTTYDFPSICTKTQAVIDAMSARMVKLGRGLNKKEILDLYNEVFNAGNPVPCPECYVFSRWIGIGGLLDNIKKYQDYYGKMSVAEVADAYKKMRSEVEAFAEEQGLSFGKAKGALTAKLTKEYNKLTEKIEKATNQGEAVKDADRKRLAELEPMMNTVKSMTWLENVYFADSALTKVNKNFRVPNEVLFDLNNGEAFATKYPEAWAFRTTQGAGYGKAITPYAEASLGEGVLVTNNTTNAIKGKARGTLNNFFLKQKGKMDAEARKALDKARLKQKIQAFLGGQRFQSTSDARYENASDYLLAALEMQAMHGMVQVYTKVDGAVPTFEAWGFSSNQSLMPLGGGLDADGNIKDTNVGGMSTKIAEANRKKHEHAGTITIGVNDNHIRALFRQLMRDFIIPYHASGGDASLIAEFRTVQDIEAKRVARVRSTDYSRTQSDKVLSDEVLTWLGKTEAEIEQIHKVREARIDILTRGKVDMDVVRGNRFLSALYDKLHGGEWDGVKLAKSKIESQIYPNEFWDQSVSYEESVKISRDYLEYCEDLGFLHRFSGLVPSNGKLIPINGYDQNGNRVQLTDLAYKYENGVKTGVVEDFYWKVLTDRRMYGNEGQYLPQQVVTLNDTTADTVTSFAKNNFGRQYDKAKSLETAKKVSDKDWGVKKQVKRNPSTYAPSVEDMDTRRADALETFGTTMDYKRAGFILPDGRMLNLSAYGMVGVNHKRIESVYEGVKGSQAVSYFINEGNVRIKETSPGIEIGADVEPSVSQYNTIARFISNSRSKGRFYVDFTDADGKTIGTLSYYDTIDTEEIKYDIKYYFKTGEVRDQEVMFQKKELSNRTILANALESSIDTSTQAGQNELKCLKEYQGKIDLIEKEEARLAEIKSEIAEISFTKGSDRSKLKSLNEEKTRTANRINTYDKQLMRLEAMKPMKDILAREKEMVRKRTEEKGREAIKAVRERAAEAQRELLQRASEQRKKAVERRKMTEVRTKIKNFKVKMEGILQRPTDNQYVPVSLVQAMVDVCSLIDTDTPLYKKDGSINKAQERRNATKERLQRLKDEYENLKKNVDPMYSGEFDEVIYEYLGKLRTDFEGKSLTDMTLAELEEMYDILKSINGTLMEARKLIGWGDAISVYEAGDTIVSEQEAITKSRKNERRNAVQKAKDSVLDFSLAPVRNIERMSGYRQNSPMLKLFQDFERGERKKNMFRMESYKAFEALTSGANAKRYADAVYKEFGAEYTDINGRKFKVSKMQMMQAILSYEREQANKMHHIEGSGFTFADLNMLRKGKLKEAVSEEYSHRIPFATGMVESFVEALASDKWAQDYMEAARQFFNGKAKDAINETYITLKHRIIARDQNYIPFEVDKNFVVREISAANDIQQTINSYGMLQETKDGASQPLIITGLNNILDRHIDQVGNVYGLAVAIRNFNKVWNVRSVASNFGGDPTVQAAIERNWGVGGKKFVTQTVQDLQGARPNTQSELYRKVKSGYIGATFMLNLSVVTKQIGSLFAATSMLKWRDPVRMIGNLIYTMANSKKISAEVDQYTAAVWMRRQGLSDAELATLATQAKKPGISKAVGKLPTALNPTKWIMGMDSMVALSLWKYAKQDTAKRTGLKGEELNKATAEFYDSLIENTQSMTDVLHRPEVQKRSDVISEAFGMFKTDLYQMAGQLQVTAGRYQHNKTKENKAALRRTVYSVAMSALWGSLMTSLFALLRYKVNQYRDDEDDELTVGSWMKKAGMGLLGDMAGYVLPLFGSEVVGFIDSIMNGEADDAVDSLALTAINDLYSAMITVANSVKEGEMPSSDEWIKLATKSLQLFGVPANNIKRTIDAVRLHAKDIANGEFLSFEAGLDKPNAQRLYNAIISGDKDRIEKATRHYKDQNAINRALRDALRYNDSRIQEAVMAHYSGDSLKRASISLEIEGEGNFDSNIVRGAINNAITNLATKVNSALDAKRMGKTAEHDKIVKELLKEYPKDFVEKMLGETILEEEEVTEDKLIGLFDVDDYYDSVLAGDSATASTILDELVSEKLAEGYLNVEAKDSVASAFSTKVKEAYIDGDITRSKAVSLLVSHGNKDASEAETEVKKCDFELKHGISWGERARAYRLGKISENALVSAIMDIEGETYKAAEEYIRFLDLEIDNPNLDITATDASKYFEYAEPAGIDIGVYLDYKERTSGMEGDKDAYGNTISGSKKAKLMQVINSLPITSSQKDALYYLNGWSASTLWQAPWH